MSHCPSHSIQTLGIGPAVLMHRLLQVQFTACVNHGYACRRFFDIRKWKIVMVDQRGCGASTPKGCLQDNNTQELIQDFEKLRVHLRVKRWMLFGGSWGVALSLAYAQQHPSRSAHVALPDLQLHISAVGSSMLDVMLALLQLM